MVGWFKQTVDKPNASLSAERRGSLSYPDIECFFFGNQSKQINFNNGSDSNNKKTRKQAKKEFSSNVLNYPFNSRTNFYNKLTENPSIMWPVGNDWSFKNKNK